VTGKEEWLTSDACVLRRWQEEQGSGGASEEGRLVAALPQWHRAAGAGQQEAGIGVSFWGCSDPQDGLTLGLLQWGLAVGAHTRDRGVTWVLVLLQQRRERGYGATISPRADGFVFVGEEHALLEISL